MQIIGGKSQKQAKMKKKVFFPIFEKGFSQTGGEKKNKIAFVLFLPNILQCEKNA